VLDDLGVGAGEIEPHAAVLGLHARREGATVPQVDRSLGRMSVVGRSVPLHDVGRRSIRAPDMIDRGRYVGFDGDSHGSCADSRDGDQVFQTMVITDSSDRDQFGDEHD